MLKKKKLSFLKLLLIGTLKIKENFHGEKPKIHTKFGFLK